MGQSLAACEPIRTGDQRRRILCQSVQVVAAHNDLQGIVYAAASGFSQSAQLAAKISILGEANK